MKVQHAQQAIKAVEETPGTPTPDNIAMTYQNMSDKETTTDELVQELAEAEKIGLVRRSLFNDQDQPLLVYKSNVPHLSMPLMKTKPDRSTKTQPSQP